MSAIDFLIQKSRTSWKEGDRHMELKLFRLLCLAATMLSFFVIIPADYLNHLHPAINLAVALFGVGTFLLFRESCRERCHTKVLFFLILTLLNLVWFANGGSLGSISYYFFCIFMYVPIFFRGKVRWLLLACAIADGVFLLVAELYFPQWVIPYRSSYYRIADLVVGFTVTALCCSLMLWALLRSYYREQKRLISLNDELQRNMAERVQAEESLRQNRALLNAVIEGTTSSVFVKDTEGRYLLFNSAAAAMTGTSAAQALGKDDTAIFPPDQARLIMAQDQNILNGSEIQTLERDVVTVKGGVKLCEITKGPLHDDQGRVIGIFGICRDITENRRMAEELRRLNEELELRVLERTARLEAAIGEQETFSYSVSHDLRGPLRHINSYAAILEEDFGASLPPDAKPFLDRIRSSSRRMGDLIDDLLELSRIGRSELRKAPVSMSELACGICCKLQDAEPARRVKFAIEPGLQAHGDAVLLGQMLDNLIGNAWKYSSPRECARIELGREVIDNSEVFFVRDNGVGFDMAYRDKLFGAFQRLHGAEFEGTGIGLATVKRIVDRHHGSVWAEAVVDQGTTVYFTLPA